MYNKLQQVVMQTQSWKKSFCFWKAINNKFMFWWLQDDINNIRKLSVDTFTPVLRSLYTPLLIFFQPFFFKELLFTKHTLLNSYKGSALNIFWRGRNCSKFISRKSVRIQIKTTWLVNQIYVRATYKSFSMSYVYLTTIYI